MSGYHKLIAFLPYFEELSRDPKRIMEGDQPFVIEATPLYTNYSHEMEEFVECMYEVEYIDGDYKSTLEEYGVTDVDEMDCKISTANEQLVKAILTKMIRDERFTSGAWITYAKKGLFEKALRRMGELY
ncbi:DUF6508 domain-containing protein [Virgibacillus flavescens]|uniref:DUF6508 domain-containing protein n=1 Tax=Virgibacillus flavescens TaxID=1611422 RepID=UPI003D32E20A